MTAAALSGLAGQADHKQVEPGLWNGMGSPPPNDRQALGKPPGSMWPHGGFPITLLFLVAFGTTGLARVSALKEVFFLGCSSFFGVINYHSEICITDRSGPRFGDLPGISAVQSSPLHVSHR